GEACAELLGDTARWQAASAAGIARVERYYTQPMMFDNYRAVYDDALQRSAARDVGLSDEVGAVATWLRGEPPLDEPPLMVDAAAPQTALHTEREPAAVAEPPQDGGSPLGGQRGRSPNVGAT
ncbi:MAG: glycosyl transferase family 1, partial [Thiomonas sp.]